MVTMNLVARLEQFRAEQQKLSWQGTFKDYFELVTENPRIARLAHARIYDMLIEQGFETNRVGEKSYAFFDDELFGIDRPLQQLVDYFSSAARRLEVRKRILLLMGPVGGGKSTIVSMLKRGLEAYTRGDQGAIYAIAGCPMHEDPLHLIPDELRPEIQREHGLYIEGDLCPVCRYRLDHDWKGDISGVTTTSGLAWKIPGRVGDSPLIGCGLYVDNEVGAAGSTGRGEECIYINGAHTVVENMRRGMAPGEAALDAVKRVAARYGNNLAELRSISMS